MQRPTKRRSAARILVISGGLILLQQDTDPGVEGSRWWVTPGGGIDPGETAQDAAVRELLEETGLEVSAELLAGPVAVRNVRHSYSDRVLIQHETFYRVDVAHFEPQPAGLTETEKQRMRGHQWFPIDALPEIVWPAQLVDLIEWSGGAPLDLGEMDESTV